MSCNVADEIEQETRDLSQQLLPLEWTEVQFKRVGIMCFHQIFHSSTKKQSIILYWSLNRRKYDSWQIDSTSRVLSMLEEFCYSRCPVKVAVALQHYILTSLATFVPTVLFLCEIPHLIIICIHLHLFLLPPAFYHIISHRTFHLLTSVIGMRSLFLAKTPTQVFVLTFVTISFST